MGNSSIPGLTSQQMDEVIRVALQCRDEEGFEFTFGSRYVKVEAYPPGNYSALGAWTIEYRLYGHIVITVALGDVVWIENITDKMPDIWPRVLGGLHDWCKAVNYIEIASLPEGSRPAHITDTSTLNPNNYSPFGSDNNGRNRASGTTVGR